MLLLHNSRQRQLPASNFDLIITSEPQDHKEGKENIFNSNDKMENDHNCILFNTSA
jgi:hypothetical protein